jgi:hypothetical protein
MYFNQLPLRAMPKTPRDKLGALFLSALNDSLPEIRADAATTVLKYHSGIDLIRPLTLLLNDPDVNVKGMAIYALIQCPDLPAETLSAILAHKDDPAPIMKELFSHIMPNLNRRVGPQRWQNGRVVRTNPSGRGRIWIEVDQMFGGGETCCIVISANGCIPTQYAPVPEGKKADAIPIDAVWFPDGNAVALIYAKEISDVVLSFDADALAGAGDSAGVKYVRPEQRPLTDEDRKILKLGTKAEYLANLVANRAKREQHRRFMLWPNGKLRSVWHVFEAQDGTYMPEGVFEVWFDDGKLNERGSTKNGKFDGRLQEWDVNGNLLTDGTWVNGKPHEGLCRDLSDASTIKQFKDGKVIPRETPVPKADF